jgi:dTDP-4-amino-4,6-dideoxygalactose transaminase
MRERACMFGICMSFNEKLERLRIGRAEMLDLMIQEVIEANVHCIPLHFHSYCRHNYTYVHEIVAFANQVLTRNICLPLYLI